MYTYVIILYLVARVPLSGSKLALLLLLLLNHFSCVRLCAIKRGLVSGNNSKFYPNQRMANPVQSPAILGVRVGKQWDGIALS